MKFLVLLLCTTFFVQCIAVKFSDTDQSYLPGISFASSWAGCIKRFYILLFLIPGIVLYYVPESRYYARKACHAIIDLVANGLKAALSGGSLSNETCLDVGRASYYSERFMSNPEIQDSVIVANAQKDHLNPSHPRRRHRVKQDSKIDEDRTRGHDRRRHRHGERSRYLREEKNRNHESQSTFKTTLKEPEIRPSTQLRIYSERTTDGFYYPETQNDDFGSKFSTSFVISGVKTTSNFPTADSNYKQGSAASLETEKYPQMISKQRNRPSKIAKSVDAVHPENDGPTRDCESFASTELKHCDKSYDIEEQIGLGTTTLDYPEREYDTSSHKVQTQNENSATSVQDCNNAAAEDSSKRVSEPNVCSAGFPPAEGNRMGRVKEAPFPVHKVNFQKKDRERNRKKILEDEDNCTPSTKSEEVLSQLGDQIAKLEKTIRIMKPEINKKERGHRNREDYAVQNIENVLKDMKRSFSKVDEQMKRRSKAKVKDRTNPPCQLREETNFGDQNLVEENTESTTSVVDEEELKAESLWSGVPHSRDKTPKEEELLEEEIVPSQMNLEILRSETLLEDEEELAPILNNRVKPYLIRTFDWLFTGCPGVSAEDKYIVGKDGVSKSTAE